MLTKALIAAAIAITGYHAVVFFANLIKLKFDPKKYAVPFAVIVGLGVAVFV